MKGIYVRNVSYFVVDSSGVFLRRHFRNLRWLKHTTTTTFIDKYRFHNVENRSNKICCTTSQS